MSKFSLFGGDKKKTGKALREEASHALLAGDFARALTLYIQLHEETPEDLRLYAKLAELREKTGDAAGSVNDYCRIAKAYAAQGYVVQAIAISKIILRIDPGKTEIQDKLRELSEERSGGKNDDFFASVARDAVPAADNIRAGLGNTPLLSGMSGEHLDSFINSLQLRHVDAGEEIYKAGEPGEHLYLIGMGQVSLQAIDARGRKKVFSHLKEGDFFGERAFMSRVAHKDEAIAESECSILVVDRDTFDRWVEGHPEMRTTVEEFYRERVLARVLAITPVFEGVPTEARMALADKFTLRTFDEDDIIMNAGEAGDTFYVIRSGRVGLRVAAPDGAEVLNATLAEGEFFGEVALLTGRPRTATVQASGGAVELMELCRADFDAITEEYPNVRKVVENYMRERAKATIDVLVRHRTDKS